MLWVRYRCEVEWRGVIKKDEMDVVDEYYKGSNLIGYRVPGGFWVDFFHKKPLIQP